MGIASQMDTTVNVYQEAPAELYGCCIPQPIEKVHKSNSDDIAIMAAVRAGHVEEAVEVSRRCVGVTPAT